MYLTLIVIFLKMIAISIALSQLNDIVISVQKISSTCEYGRRLIFRDVNKDNIFDEIRRYDCDNSVYINSLKIIGDKTLLSGLAGELISGDFKGKDFKIRVYDPFKKETWGYVYYDSNEDWVIIDFLTVTVFEYYLEVGAKNKKKLILTKGDSEIILPIICNDNFFIQLFDINGNKLNNNLVKSEVGNYGTAVKIYKLAPSIYFLVTHCENFHSIYKLFVY